MLHETLDSMFDVTPEPTTNTPVKNVVQQAADILDAETVCVADDATPVEVANTASTAVSTVAPVDTSIDSKNQDLQTDFDYARERIKDLIDQNNTALQGALELAEAGDKPGAYRVVGELISAGVQANKELVGLHKTRKESEREVKGTTGTDAAGVTIERAVFIGRASDMLRELKKAKKGLKDAT